MQTDADRRLPGENFGVVRLRRNVLNPSSTAGLMVTTYSGGGRLQRRPSARDTSLRVWGDDYVVLEVGGDVLEDGTARAGGRSRGAAASSTRSGSGVTGRGSVVHLAVRARGRRLPAGARLHAAPQLHDRQRRGELVLLHRQEQLSSAASIPGALAFSTFGTPTTALESGQYAFWVQWDTKAGGGGWVEPKWFRENVIAPFTIGGSVHIPRGMYDFADLQLVYTMPTGSRLRTNVDFRAGTYFDGKRTQVIVAPTWNVSKHLELGAGYQMTRLRFDGRDEKATFNSWGCGSARRSTSGRRATRSSSTTRRPIALDFNVRLRYNVERRHGLVDRLQRRAGHGTRTVPVRPAR